ncbi:unnamed protein product [Darwinula stevensoni]|uniref:C-type lectin domain-containing protein n=1 Tax=Darwinula stevensoni TaxID=69355 RepID=A0A7R9A9K9_9CRUS|nr:unnamed protein product [Darwinula stevensoni]CAG0897525.1 unnamed protein product [Darwinula stevensoni]
MPSRDTNSSADERRGALERVRLSMGPSTGIRFVSSVLFLSLFQCAHGENCQSGNVTLLEGSPLRVTRASAAEICGGLRGALPEIEDSVEAWNEDIWVGLKVESTWNSGNDIEYWDANSLCFYYNFTRNSMEKADCKSSLGVYCSLPAGFECRSQLPYNRSYTLKSGSATTFEAAKALCDADGGTLPIHLDDPQVRQKFLDFVSPLAPNEFWVGLEEAASGGRRWADGKALCEVATFNFDNDDILTFPYTELCYRYKKSENALKDRGCSAASFSVVCEYHDGGILELLSPLPVNASVGREICEGGGGSLPQGLEESAVLRAIDNLSREISLW